MKKVAVFLAEGLEEVEGLTVVDLLRRAGIDVKTVALSSKKEVTGARQITIKADACLEELDFTKQDGVVLPGGMPGTTHLMEHEGVNRTIREFAEQGKLVAAICAAPVVLGKAGLLQGRRATCYPGMEDQLTGAECCEDAVVWDGNIITSRGVGTAIPFALTLTEYFLGAEKAKEIGDSIVYGAWGGKS